MSDLKEIANRYSFFAKDKKLYESGVGISFDAPKWELFEQELKTHISNLLDSTEQEVKFKLLASINSFLAEKGITDTDGTPLTFSPERF